MVELISILAGLAIFALIGISIDWAVNNGYNPF